MSWRFVIFILIFFLCLELLLGVIAPESAVGIQQFLYILFVYVSPLALTIWTKFAFILMVVPTRSCGSFRGSSFFHPLPFLSGKYGTFVPIKPEPFQTIGN